MPIPVALLGLAGGSGLLLAGFAMASNWHSWADRYAGWYKSNLGFLGVWHVSDFHALPRADLDRHWSCGSRRYRDAVCSRGAAVGRTCRFIRIERVRKWRLLVRVM